MVTKIQDSTLVLPNLTLRSDLTIENGSITAIGNSDVQADTVLRLPNAYVCPGFVDLQANGGGGSDFSEATHDAVSQAANFHLSHGTTTLLATIITQDLQNLRAGLKTIHESDVPNVFGCHLEGPFISTARAGAHPTEYILAPDRQRWKELTRDLVSSVALTTLAPELPATNSLIEQIQTDGVGIAMGHSDATYEQACHAFDQGVGLATHLFNAMRGFHHREPGAIGAALDDDVCVSLITDGLHVHPGALRLATGCKGPDETCLITDAISATGMPAGSYQLGSQTVHVQDGQARLDDGTLAGSLLTMDEAIRVVATATDDDLPDIVQMASLTPATLLGISDRKGKIAEGYDADLVVLNRDLEVEYVLLAGDIVYDRHNDD